MAGNNKFLKVGVGIVVVFLIGIFLKLAKSVLVPFFLALFLSYALSPLLSFLTSRRIPKTITLVVLLLGTFICLYLLGALFYSSGKSLAEELPSYNEMMQDFLEGIERTFPDEGLRIGLTDWVKSLNIEKLGGVLVSALGPFFSFTSGLLLVFIFMLFILVGRGRMEGKIHRAFPEDQAAAVSRTVKQIDHEIQKYLAVKTLVNASIGLLTALVLMAFGFRFALLFGFLAFLFNYIPTLGALLATAVPFLLAALYYASPWPVFGILVCLAAIHIVLLGRLEARLMGRDLNLSPLLVLFSLFVWWWLWGIPGMFLAVPILAVIKITFRNIPSLMFIEALMDK